MYQSQVSVRYAKALIEFAQEHAAMDAVAEDMQTLISLFAEVPELHQVVEHPSLTETQKIALFQSLFKNSFHKQTNRFIEFVCKQKRENQLPGMAHNYLTRFAQLRGLKTAVFTTAVPMGQKEREAVVKMVEKHYHVTLEFSEKVDKDLIGGFVIEIDDKRIDASVAAQLKQIKQQLLAQH